MDIFGFSYSETKMKKLNFIFEGYLDDITIESPEVLAKSLGQVHNQLS